MRVARPKPAEPAYEMDPEALEKAYEDNRRLGKFQDDILDKLEKHLKYEQNMEKLAKIGFWVERQLVGREMRLRKASFVPKAMSAGQTRAAVILYLSALPREELKSLLSEVKNGSALASACNRAGESEKLVPADALRPETEPVGSKVS